MRLTLAILLSALSIALVSCGDSNRIPLNVELGTRSVSKLPFVIAEDQGLYAKYGLDVDLRMPPPKVDGAISTHAIGLRAQLWRKLRSFVSTPEPWERDIHVDGLTPAIVKLMDQTRSPHPVAIAGVDCVVRAHIVGNHGIASVEALRGKRLGISARTDTTTGFVALMLARRMGWDPVRDISIKRNGRDVDALREGLVDAIVASETRFAEAKKAGFPILMDTREWDMAIAGNSVMVEPEWLERSVNRDAAERFLKATIEALALFYRDRDLAIRVLAKWHGISDPDIANTIYDRGRWLSQRPYPCYAGIAATMELYDSNAMRRYRAEDFYDDSLVRELDESGFIDAMYD